MTEPTYPMTVPRSLWMRTLMMLLMAIAFQLSAWVLGAIALLQLVLAAFAGGPNARLRRFGQSLGRYLAQVTGFLTFASEEAPFPFADWPAGD
ncbi:MAG: DUF4389 domain-containing protein [Ramlibacter sp.]|nr:DUF4389 domain-containing protein [Ramlibacter sp.]